MKIAIIGAGFAARGASHFLKEHGEITVFDKGELSASRLAAGLLHKFVGLHAYKSPNADEAMDLARSLIQPKKKTGLLRIAENEKQWQFFKKTAETYPNEVKIASDKAIWIEEAYVVDCPAYLEPLKFIKKDVLSLSELDAFDLIILAGGADSIKLADLPINPIPGQLIEVTGINMPKHPLTGGCYAIPLLEKMIVGATYERTPQDAKKVLLPKLEKLLPDFVLSEVADIKRATRASTPDHLPFIQQINAKTWALSGLGSKGLLYHAYYGKLLASKIMTM